MTPITSVKIVSRIPAENGKLKAICDIELDGLPNLEITVMVSKQTANMKNPERRDAKIRLAAFDAAKAKIEQSATDHAG